MSNAWECGTRGMIHAVACLTRFQRVRNIVDEIERAIKHCAASFRNDGRTTNIYRSTSQAEPCRHEWATFPCTNRPGTDWWVLMYRRYLPLLNPA